MPHRPKPRNGSNACYSSKLLSKPPGLDLDWIELLSRVESVLGEFDVVDLARRVQRFELLLFLASGDMFQALDARIARILNEDSRGTDEVTLVTLPQPEAYACEVFSMCEDELAYDENGLPTIHDRATASDALTLATEPLLRCDKAHGIVEVSDALPDTVATLEQNTHACEHEPGRLHEPIELEDAPGIAFDTSDCCMVGQGYQTQHGDVDQVTGMEGKINVAVLRSVNSTFAATIPMVIENVQARIDESYHRLEQKVDSQKAELATLASYIASSSSKRNPKR